MSVAQLLHAAKIAITQWAVSSAVAIVGTLQMVQDVMVSDNV